MHSISSVSAAIFDGAIVNFDTKVLLTSNSPPSRLQNSPSCFDCSENKVIGPESSRSAGRRTLCHSKYDGLRQMNDQFVFSANENYLFKYYVLANEDSIANETEFEYPPTKTSWVPIGITYNSRNLTDVCARREANTGTGIDAIVLGVCLRQRGFA